MLLTGGIHPGESLHLPKPLISNNQLSASIFVVKAGNKRLTNLAVPPITKRSVLFALAAVVECRTAASNRGHFARLARSLEHLLRDQSHDAVKHEDWQPCSITGVYSSNQ